MVLTAPQQNHTNVDGNRNLMEKYFPRRSSFNPFIEERGKERRVMYVACVG